ncbi:HpcH/HpaI aldolase/citrate lyase family protein [Nocardia testacea]|uniref:HpcH/HpaI aldolase/citrate lyase family protein n=1 Tax=Nocardia testacea TaxID=248551 RepID=A0ABW7VPY4_9NOCA
MRLSPRSTISPGLARSWLLVAASTTTALAEAVASDADAVVIDLEDGVAEHRKEHARRLTREWLDTSPPVWIRVNDVSTPHWRADLDALAGAPNLAGVMLAKTEHPDQVEETAARLGGTPVVALIESALGLEEARPIARCTATVRLAFGSGDYRKDTGAADTALALAYPRSRLVVASRAERIPPPIDGPTHSATDDGLRSGTADGAATGMTGKLCLHTAHTGIVNAALSPTDAELRWAEEVIERLGADGTNVQYGSERPVLERALRIRTRRQSFASVDRRAR